MEHQSIYRRVLRRETHSSRSGAAVALAASLAVVLLGLLVIGIWAFADAAFRADASRWIAGVAAGLNGTALLIGAGILSLVIALGLLFAALAPGRRARHARVTERVALVVDDGVLADAAADAVARECVVERRQVSTTMGRRALAVRVTPTSGIPVDRGRVTRVAEEAIAGAGFIAPASVDVARNGVIA